MLKLTRWFMWGFLTLILFTAFDQVLLRVDLPLTGYQQVHEFYRDFRTRLLRVAGFENQDPVARIIAHDQQQPPAQPAIQRPSKVSKVRYLYADQDGNLQFADRLDLVPLQFRRDAQPMAAP